jgi:uncharacterized protein
MPKTYEIRDPIHGFITLNEWEREIIDQPAFQRLRRIRQLGLTDMVYPGAMHTRFEHSLGVMHIATLMFDEIVERRSSFLKNTLNYNDDGLGRDRVIIRLAALLHDIGHTPFSHAGEELMCKNPHNKKRFKHENYSAAIIKLLMKDVIEDHPMNQNYRITAQEIAQFLEGGLTDISPEKSLRNLFWHDLVSGQLDADRADYLLRDSYHIGVAYGNYDLNRLLKTLTVVIDPETESPKLAIEEGGIHSAEALIIARYMMFTQVYFQHTRRAYDHHFTKMMKELLVHTQQDGVIERKDCFPPPTNEESIKEYLKWNDWKVLGMIDAGNGGEHASLLSERHHHRCVYETFENPDQKELDFIEHLDSKLLDEGLRDKVFRDKAGNSWYKFESAEISVLSGNGDKKNLSASSTVVNGLKPINQFRIYAPYREKSKIKKLIDNFR